MINYSCIIRICIITVLLYFSSSQFVIGDSTLQKNYKLNWYGLQQEKYDDEPRQYLSIGESLYLDSVQGIPYFFDRFKIDVPHISYDISLVDVEVDKFALQETEFLKEKGFENEDFVLETKLVSERGERYLEVRLIPLRYNNTDRVYEKLVSFTLEKKYIYDEKYGVDKVHDYAEESILASGDWYKLCVDETGIYKLDYSNLESLGIDPDDITRQNFSLFGNGTGMLPEANDEYRYDDLKQNPIYVSGDPNGKFSSSDYILFYGKSPHQWSFNEDNEVWEHEVHLYSDHNCYFLTVNRGEGKRISQRSSVTESATTTKTTFVDYDYHQEDKNNLIGSGRYWYGEVFNVTLSGDFHFSFDDLVDGGKGYLKTHVAARSSSQSSFLVSAGESQQQINVSSVNMASVTGDYANYSEDSFYFTQTSSDVPVEISYNPTSTGAIGWLNYIALNVERELYFREPYIIFRSTGSEDVVEFKLANANENVEIWDVSDRFDIKKQQGSLQGNEFTFRVQGKEEEKMRFVAHDGSDYHTPELKGKIPNQNLHGEESSELLIVTPPKFLDEAERLANFRNENDGLSVLVVTTNQVYNEFSSGAADISAIRNFVKMFYDRAEGPEQIPRYLLLFGNGTYDNKDIKGYGGNLIPTFQTRNSLNYSRSWISDDFFGLLADDEGEGATGNLDIGIGRLPARTQSDASSVVDKIIRYDKRIEGWNYDGDNYDYAGYVSNYGDWRNRVSLISDDGDNNVHFNDAEELYDLMKADHGVYNIEKIYLDAYEKVIMAGGERYPEVNKSINNLVNKGALLINYIGHGGFNGLAHERVLTFDDIQSWTNYYNLPVFMTATCQFSAFDKPDPSNLSAGVRIFLKRDGGASALFTTTRLAWAGSNRTLNRNFMSNAFNPMDNGELPRLGDIIRKAKVASGSGSQIMNFVLLGDPSMQLAYPSHKVKTAAFPDTVRALEPVNVEGQVVNRNGEFLDDYNGIVYPTVYDKRRTFETLGNSSDSYPAEFDMRENIIFKGKVEVKDGMFDFDFIVPRDIGYNFGNGKISYYFDDGQVDGHGYYDQFLVGGSADDYEPDNEGPQIDLYLNDTSFVSGENVDTDPLLLAYIFDESGINTTGQLGHNIVARLSGEKDERYVLNDYYESDLNTFKSGRIIYPFSELDEGEYNLSLRVWDVHNNPSEASIDFIVAGTMEFALKNLINYPNPFSNNTTFEFSYTETDEYEMDVRVEIYNIMGQRVASIQQEGVNVTGFDDIRFDWNATGDDGKILESGLYIYEVTVFTPDGKTASESSRLVIMR